jgi:hypothetical protein
MTTTTCPECVPCEGDGCDRTAYCLAQPGTRPYAHDRALCDDCRLAECVACRADEDRQRLQVVPT